MPTFGDHTSLPVEHGQKYGTPVGESSPVDIRDAARKWWSQHQDDFVQMIAGTGMATHSLYDVPEALAAFAAHMREGK